MPFQNCPKSSAHPQADSARLAKVGEENSKFLLFLMTRNSNQSLFRIAPKSSAHPQADFPRLTKVEKRIVSFYYS